jgi:hypothetical protein
MKANKISAIIFMAEKFRVRFHLKLDGDIVNEYRFNDKVYLNISTTSYVTFDNLNVPINERGMDSSVMITNKSIFSTITSMNKMKNNLYENDIFAYDNGKLITYADEVKKSSVVIKLYGGYTIILVPCVVLDMNDIQYEGVRMFLNNTSNYVDLPIDIFESLLYTLTKIDFFQYSSLLMNMYTQSYNSDGIVKSVYDQNNNKNNLNDKPRINWNNPVEGISLGPKRGDKEFEEIFNPKTQ